MYISFECETNEPFKIIYIRKITVVFIIRTFLVYFFINIMAQTKHMKRSIYCSLFQNMYETPLL